MLNSIRRRGDTSNTIVGIILLVVLLVFIGPDVLPQLLSKTFPFMDEATPCSWLRTAENRGFHQSLIGRSAVDPLSLRTIVETRPAQGSADMWEIRIIIQNETIGTVPIVYSETGVIVGDDTTSSGIGLIFEPQVNGLTTGQFRQNTGVQTFSEDNIRILGPRQRCVHSVQFTSQQASLVPASTTIRSYYRVTGEGIVQANPQIIATPIFTDQGLYILEDGYTESARAEIPLVATTE